MGHAVHNIGADGLPLSPPFLGGSGSSVAGGGTVSSTSASASTALSSTSAKISTSRSGPSSTATSITASTASSASATSSAAPGNLSQETANRAVQLRGGTLAGVILGSVLGVLLLLFLLWLLLRLARRQRGQRTATRAENGEKPHPDELESHPYLNLPADWPYVGSLLDPARPSINSENASVRGRFMGLGRRTEERARISMSANTNGNGNVGRVSGDVANARGNRSVMSPIGPTDPHLMPPEPALDPRPRFSSKISLSHALGALSARATALHRVSGSVSRSASRAVKLDASKALSKSESQSGLTYHSQPSTASFGNSPSDTWSRRRRSSVGSKRKSKQSRQSKQSRFSKQSKQSRFSKQSKQSRASRNSPLLGPMVDLAEPMPSMPSLAGLKRTPSPLGQPISAAILSSTPTRTTNRTSPSPSPPQPTQDAWTILASPLSETSSNENEHPHLIESGPLADVPSLSSATGILPTASTHTTSRPASYSALPHSTSLPTTPDPNPPFGITLPATLPSAGRRATIASIHTPPSRHASIHAMSVRGSMASGRPVSRISAVSGKGDRRSMPHRRVPVPKISSELQDVQDDGPDHRGDGSDAHDGLDGCDGRDVTSSFGVGVSEGPGPSACPPFDSVGVSTHNRPGNGVNPTPVGLHHDLPHLPHPPTTTKYTVCPSNTSTTSLSASSSGYYTPSPPSPPALPSPPSLPRSAYAESTGTTRLPVLDTEAESESESEGKYTGTGGGTIVRLPVLSGSPTRKGTGQSQMGMSRIPVYRSRERRGHMV